MMTYPADVPPAAEAPSMNGQLEANLAVLFVLVCPLGTLKLGDASHFRPPLRRVIHVVSARRG